MQVRAEPAPFGEPLNYASVFTLLRAKRWKIFILHLPETMS